MNYIIIPGIKKGYLSKRALSMETVKTYTPDTILKLVCQHFNISETDLKSRSRERRFSYPRHICIWIMYKMTSMSLKHIGGLFGRDHTTAIHSRDEINNLMEVDSIVKGEVESLLIKL